MQKWKNRKMLPGVLALNLLFFTISSMTLVSLVGSWRRGLGLEAVAFFVVCKIKNEAKYIAL